MTEQDKPGAVALEAAGDISTRVFGSSDGKDVMECRVIIQAAIDEATAKVEAELENAHEWANQWNMTGRIYPDEMTEDIEFILGMQNFQACPWAHLFRAAGADIPRKVEAEQAFVTHWLLKLVLDHGAGWRDEAKTHMEAARAALKRAEPASYGPTRSHDGDPTGEMDL